MHPATSISHALQPRAEYHPNLGHSSLPVQHSFSQTLQYPVSDTLSQKNTSVPAEGGIGTDASQNNGGCERLKNPCDLAQAFCHALVIKEYILRLDRTSFEGTIKVDQKKARVAFNKPV